MKKIVKDGIIIALSALYGADISDEEYREIYNVIQSKPSAPEGFEYRLKDTLEWELYKPEALQEDMETATPDDYETALGRFGV